MNSLQSTTTTGEGATQSSPADLPISNDPTTTSTSSTSSQSTSQQSDDQKMIASQVQCLLGDVLDRVAHNRELELAECCDLKDEDHHGDDNQGIATHSVLPEDYNDNNNNIGTEAAENQSDVTTSNISDIIQSPLLDSSPNCSTVSHNADLGLYDDHHHASSGELSEHTTNQSLSHLQDTRDNNAAFSDASQAVLLAVQMCNTQLMQSDLIYFFCIAKFDDQPSFLKTPKTFNAKCLTAEELELKHLDVNSATNNNENENQTNIEDSSPGKLISTNIARNMARESSFLNELLVLGFNYCIGLKNSYIITGKRLKKKIDILIDLKSSDFQNTSVRELLENNASDILIINSPAGVYLISKRFEGLSVLLQLFKSIRSSDMAIVYQILSFCSRNADDLLKKQFFKVTHDSSVRCVKSIHAGEGNQESFHIQHSINAVANDFSDKSINSVQESSTNNQNLPSIKKTRAKRRHKNATKTTSGDQDSLQESEVRTPIRKAPLTSKNYKYNNFIDTKKLNRKMLAKHKIFINPKWISKSRFNRLPEDVKADYRKRYGDEVQIALEKHNLNEMSVTNKDLKNMNKSPGHAGLDHRCKYDDLPQINGTDIAEQFEKINTKTIRLTSAAQQRLDDYKNQVNGNKNNLDALDTDNNAGPCASILKFADNNQAGQESSFSPLGANVLSITPKNVLINQSVKDQCEEHLLSSQMNVQVNPFKELDDGQIKEYEDKVNDPNRNRNESGKKLVFDLQADVSPDLTCDSMESQDKIYKDESISSISSSSGKLRQELGKSNDIENSKMIKIHDMRNQNSTSPNTSETMPISIDEEDDQKEGIYNLQSSLKHTSIVTGKIDSTDLINKDDAQLNVWEKKKEKRKRREQHGNKKKESKLSKIFHNATTLHSTSRSSDTLSRSFRGTLSKIFRGKALPTELKITNLETTTNEAATSLLQSEGVGEPKQILHENADDLSMKTISDNNENIKNQKPKKRHLSTLRRFFNLS
ncbi:MAG: hypothetical protein MHMPM18_000787 [Marteilia pararefringens]